MVIVPIFLRDILFYFRVYIERTSYNTLKLYLTSIDERDEGKYSCEAYILGMKFHQFAEVMIFGNDFICYKNSDLVTHVDNRQRNILFLSVNTFILGPWGNS